MTRKPRPGKKARLKAQKLFGTGKLSEAEALDEKNKTAAATRSKMERLRSLRLDREAAHKVANDKKAPPKKTRARRPPPDGR